MSEKNQNVELLERNIVLLLNKLEENHHALQSLTEQLEVSKAQQNEVSEENKTLKKAKASLEMANALLGSNESNTKTKNKINALIQQVEGCMIQLQNTE
jgi:predicted nuclease with TOPRIM domain